MKGITWTQVAQYGVLITAFLIPAFAYGKFFDGFDAKSSQSDNHSEVKRTATLWRLLTASPALYPQISLDNLRSVASESKTDGHEGKFGQPAPCDLKAGRTIVFSV